VQKDNKEQQQLFIKRVLKAKGCDRIDGRQLMFILHTQRPIQADHSGFLRDTGGRDAGADRIAEGEGALRKGLTHSQTVVIRVRFEMREPEPSMLTVPAAVVAHGG